MEFNQQDDEQNSIISTHLDAIELSGRRLSMPCFVSTIYACELAKITLESIDNTTLFAHLKKDDVKILIIGTGASVRFLPSSQQVKFRQIGVAVESMNNSSAISSFNLLLSDRRQVGLLLL